MKAMDSINGMKRLAWSSLDVKLPEMQETLKTLQTEAKKLPKVRLVRPIYGLQVIMRR